MGAASAAKDSTLSASVSVVVSPCGASKGLAKPDPDEESPMSSITFVGMFGASRWLAGTVEL